MNLDERTIACARLAAIIPCDWLRTEDRPVRVIAALHEACRVARELISENRELGSCVPISTLAGEMFDVRGGKLKDHAERIAAELARIILNDVLAGASSATAAR